MTYRQMMIDLISKFGAESYEVLLFRLMWISYKSKGKTTYEQIKEYHKLKIRKNS